MEVLPVQVEEMPVFVQFNIGLVVAMVERMVGVVVSGTTTLQWVMVAEVMVVLERLGLFGREPQDLFRQHRQVTYDGTFYSNS